MPLTIAKNSGTLVPCINHKMFSIAGLHLIREDRTFSRENKLRIISPTHLMFPSSLSPVRQLFENYPQGKTWLTK
jgi:hypothetical protein